MAQPWVSEARWFRPSSGSVVFDPPGIHPPQPSAQEVGALGQEPLFHGVTYSVSSYLRVLGRFRKAATTRGPGRGTLTEPPPSGEPVHSRVHGDLRRCSRQSAAFGRAFHPFVVRSEREGREEESGVYHSQQTNGSIGLKVGQGLLTFNQRVKPFFLPGGS